ncbi:MAG: PAS domain S-box protein, partial [Cyanobacteria bacterium]|nr:PAS domain S-box protein [Cyanobacteriota bacterium]
MQLSLSRKIWFIVAVPLTFELVFICVLLLLQHNAAEANAKELRSKQFLAKLYQTTLTNAEIAHDFVIYINTKDPEAGKRFDEHCRGAIGSAGRFEKTQGLNREQVKELTKALSMELKIAEQLMMIREAVARDQESSLIDQQFIMQNAFRTLRSMQQSAHRVAEIESAKSAKYAIEQKHARMFQLVWALAGFIVNVSLTTFLALFVLRNVNDRLSTVILNTNRLARKDLLLPRVQGDDEIAQLDGAFHTMADALIRAEIQERAIVDHSADVIFSLSEKLCFQKINSAAEKSWLYEPAELESESVLSILRDEESDNLSRSLREMIENDLETLEKEVHVKRKDGSDLWTLWSISWTPS